MSVPVRLAAFAVGVATAFGVGLGVGNVVGPLDDEPAHDLAPPGDGHGDHWGGGEDK